MILTFASLTAPYFSTPTKHAGIVSRVGIKNGWRGTFPAAASLTLAKIQAWTHIVGAILFPIGIAIVLTRGPSAEVFPIAGSFIVLAATIMFAIVVFRTARK